MPSRPGTAPALDQVIDVPTALGPARATVTTPAGDSPLGRLVLGVCLGALLTHYGSPMLTTNNSIVIPVKTGATGGYRVEARNGATGALLWQAATDYVLPPRNWTPPYNLLLTAQGRLYAPGAGGKLKSCGWVEDAWGLSWQLIPKAWFDMVRDPDPARVQRVFQAIWQMEKIDLAALKRAYDGA
jgi:hypothetical protein